MGDFWNVDFQKSQKICRVLLNIQNWKTSQYAPPTSFKQKLKIFWFSQHSFCFVKQKLHSFKGGETLYVKISEQIMTLSSLLTFSLLRLIILYICHIFSKQLKQYSNTVETPHICRFCKIRGYHIFLKKKGSYLAKMFLLRIS